MNKNILAFIVVLLTIVLISGCGTATPTRPPVPLATPTALVITVVVTPTPVPVTATPEPILATTPTTAATTQAAGTPTRGAAQPTATAGAPRATNTPRPVRTATPASASPTATAVPLKFGEPRLRGPAFQPASNLTQRDERHFPGDALIFQWEPMPGLNGDECYMLSVTFQPGQNDTFLAGCGNSGLRADVIEFRLNQPSREGPNYAGLLPNPQGDTTVSWNLTIVKDLGVGSGPNAPDGRRHSVVPLSPRSTTFQFPLKGS